MKVNLKNLLLQMVVALAIGFVCSAIGDALGVPLWLELFINIFVVWNACNYMNVRIPFLARESKE